MTMIGYRERTTYRAAVDRPQSQADAPLHYVARGAGTPVIFVHGSLGDYRSWGYQLGAFTEHYRAIAYSRRYHFPNPDAGEPGTYTAARHAADLAAFIDDLGLGAAHLVAESYGACVALVCARRWPHLVRTLALGEPPLIPWLDELPGGGELLADYLATALRPAQQACHAGALERAAATFFDGTTGRPGAFDRLPDPVRTALLDNAPALRLDLLSIPSDMAGATGGDYFGPFSRADARAIACPTLLLAGARSPALFRRITDMLADCLPAAGRVVISGAAHALAASQPAAYNKAVLTFLAAH